MNPFTVLLSWSVLGHVLSEEQSKDGSDGVSNDGRLTIVQCHHYHRPLLGDAPLRPMFPPIFLCHLCIFLLIVASPRWSALAALIPESDGHMT